MKYLYSLLVFMLLTLSVSSAQNATTALVEGKVIDVAGSKPVGTSMLFINSSGKRSQCKSNSIDGAFQQSLSSGDSYIIIMKDYVLENQSFKLVIPETRDYKEYKQEIRVREIDRGIEILNFKAFQPNSTELITSNIAELQSIKSFLEMNKMTRISIYVAGDGKSKSAQKAPAKKTKKSKLPKLTADTPKTQPQSIFQSRINSIKKYFEGMQLFFTADTFIEDIKSAPAKSKKKSAPVAAISRENMRVVIR